MVHAYESQSSGVGGGGTPGSVRSSRAEESKKHNASYVLASRKQPKKLKGITPPL
jgi:hypothetical protein